MLKRIVQHSKCRLYSLKSKSILAPTTGTEPDNANALPTDYAQRLAFMQASNDTSPYYPHQRSLTTWIALSLFHPTYSHLQPSQSLPTDLISITGRVSSIRSSGEHLHFVDVSEGDDRVQIVLTPDHYINGENFGKDVSGVQRGDVVEVHGMPYRTMAGELSIRAIAVNRLAPCLLNLPSQKHPLTDIDKAIRHRHLDLLSNPSKLQTFRQRARILSFLRAFMEKEGYLEVETPVLSSQIGGAIATPFTTASRFARDPLHLRIAPELYLKQCIVSGMRKVYELGKVFRNEGVDATHNPEFTSLEFYAAYQDTNEAMSLLETLISSLAVKLHGDAVMTSSRGKKVDMYPPYPRIEIVPFLEDKLGIKFDFEDPDGLKYQLAGCLFKSQVEKTTTTDQFRDQHTTHKLFDRLIEQHIVPLCQHPTFLSGHPAFMSPLAKPQKEHPHLSDRFELFIDHQEIANCHVEQNDPIAQARAFNREQLGEGMLEEGRVEVTGQECANEEFVKVLMAGMPPTVGCGIGVDRLVMLLTGSRHIRDVILFPHLQ